MNAIDIQIKRLIKCRQLGLMTHAVLGYPTMEKSFEIIKTLILNDSDFLELQIPFSDPVADGETIMKACEVAFRNGMNTDKAFEMINYLVDYSSSDPPAGGESRSSRQARTIRIIPILLMAYYNTVFRYGVEKFCRKANELKVSGLIVPDIPSEEETSEKFISTSLKYDLYPIRVVSPSSSIERLKINAKFAKGFVYCVSHFGVTGSKTEIDSRLTSYINKVKQVIKMPVAVGFGLSKAGQIQKLKGIADIAIVGSEIIKNYDSGGVNKVTTFIRSLKAVTI